MHVFFLLFFDCLPTYWQAVVIVGSSSLSLTHTQPAKQILNQQRWLTVASERARGL